jgi:dephospho-CoA kinase
MLKVAVTGNIGSGKTSVCRVFESLGVPVFYSDTEAKKLYSDPEILQKMVEKFGKGILNQCDGLDTKVFASIIFNDRNALSYVNSIIHPQVYRIFSNWCTLHKDKPWCIMESALVFETGRYKIFDKVILVYAPQEILLKRIAKRDDSSPDDIKKRLDNQTPDKTKLKLADYFIRNDNSELIIPQLLRIHEELTAVSSANGKGK